MRYYLSQIHNRNCTISIHGLHNHWLANARYFTVQHDADVSLLLFLLLLLIFLHFIRFTVVGFCLCVYVCLHSCFNLSFYDTLWRSFVHVCGQFSIHFHRSTWANDSIYLLVCTLNSKRMQRFVVNTIKLMQWHDTFAWTGKWKWTHQHWHETNPSRPLNFDSLFVCSFIAQAIKRVANESIVAVKTYSIFSCVFFFPLSLFWMCLGLWVISVCVSN